MRALVYDGTVRYDAGYPDPKPAAGEALIKIRLAGICNTDLEIARGYMQYQGVLGHEFVGEVVAAAETGWVGRRVVGEINAPCQACPTCREVTGNHCPHRTVLGIAGRNGTFAELVTLPIANLHKVPNGVSDEAALFTEPLAAAFQVLDQVHIRPSDRIIVLGDGKLGQLVARVLALTGCDLLAVGKHAEKLQLLAAAGILNVYQATLPDERFDIVVDCTGSASGFAQALRLTRPRGTLVLKSTVADPSTLNLAPIVIDEIRVIGSRCGPFVPALRALASGRIDPVPLLSVVRPLSDGVKALAEAAKPGVLKVALKP